MPSIEIFSSVASGVFANYIYKYLSRKTAPRFGISAYLPVPEKTLLHVDSCIEAFVERKISEFKNAGIPAAEKLFQQIKVDDEHSIAHVLIDSALFSDEIAVETLVREISSFAEPGELKNEYISGQDINKIAIDIVSDIKDTIFREMPYITRIADSIKNAAKSLDKIDRINKIVEASPTKVESTDGVDVYSRYIREKFRHMFLSGFDSFVKSDSFLNDFDRSFVSLFLGQDSDFMEASIPAEDVVLTEPYLVLRGNPGSGKTTLMQWVCVNHNTNKFNVPVVPFLIPLREVISRFQGKYSIAGLFQIACDDIDLYKSLGEGWMERTLKCYNSILMLDGVDEVPFKERRRFWMFVERVTKEYPRCRVIITSRNLYYTHDSNGKYKDPLGMSEKDFSKSRFEWSPPSGFLDFQILGLSSDDVTSFIDRWHRSIDTSRLHPGLTKNVDQLASKLKQRLIGPNSDRSLRELCSTPMFCTLFCLVNLVERGRLPNTPKKLYREALDILLQSRDEIRGVVVDERFERIEKDIREQILEFIAICMQETSVSKHNYLIEVEKDDLIEWISQYRDRYLQDEIGDLDSEEILWFLTERVSVLREPTGGFIDFVHRSFMEYLAAEHFVKFRPQTLIREYAKIDQWHGTIRFMVNSDAGGVIYNKAILEEILKFIYSEQGSKNYIPFVESIVECLDNIPIDCFDNYQKILELLRPIHPDRAKNYRNVHFNVLNSVVGTPSGYDWQAVTEAAYLYLYHKSEKSKDVLRKHYTALNDDKFIFALNRERKIGIVDQEALLARISKQSFDHLTHTDIEVVYCDDMNVLKNAMIGAVGMSSECLVIRRLIIDSNTIGLERDELFNHIREVFIDSTSEQFVKLASEVVLNASRGTILVLRRDMADLIAPSTGRVKLVAS